MIRRPGEPAGRPQFFGAIATATPCTAGNGTLFGVLATNYGSAGAALVVADTAGTLFTLQVPAKTSVPMIVPEGFSVAPSSEPAGALTLTPSATLDVTVFVL